MTDALVKTGPLLNAWVSGLCISETIRQFTDGHSAQSFSTLILGLANLWIAIDIWRSES